MNRQTKNLRYSYLVYNWYRQVFDELGSDYTDTSRLEPTIYWVSVIKPDHKILNYLTMLEFYVNKGIIQKNDHIWLKIITDLDENDFSNRYEHFIGFLNDQAAMLFTLNQLPVDHLEGKFGI